MSSIKPIFNGLLNMMSREDFALFEPHLERVPLPARQLLEPANIPTAAVYFVEHGLASVVARAPSGKEIEVGVIGSEGMTGIGVVQGDTQSVFETFMQIEGAGFRLSADRLRQAIAGSRTLGQLLNLDARAFSVQLAATALANGRTKLEERLARWLVMVQDRVGSDTFNLTHDFLATMLGVRRPGVTVALQLLEGKGLIRSSRAAIVILDRAGLIASSNGAYGLPEAEYRRLLDSPWPQTAVRGSQWEDETAEP
jgi:CRP-like cAMP-binding protein